MESEDLIIIYIVVGVFFILGIIVTTICVNYGRAFSFATWSCNRSTIENTFVNLSKRSYQKMIELASYDYAPNYDTTTILELGAGNGISTREFVNVPYLRYDANKLLEKYRSDLEQIPNINVHICDFTDMQKNMQKNMQKTKYNIIFLTCFSAINDDNILHLYAFCDNETCLITYYRDVEKIKKYFDIVKKIKLDFFGFQHAYLLRKPRRYLEQIEVKIDEYVSNKSNVSNASKRSNGNLYESIHENEYANGYEF